jgi:hypothetical protein
MTGTCPSGVEDLRYIKILNFNNSGGGRNFTGEIAWFKFYNGTNSPSNGTLTKEYDFTAGDAQSVSTISNKAGLKAHYTMDTETANTIEQTQGGSNRTVMGQGNELHYGIILNSGSALIGKTISNAHFRLKMNNNPASENLVYCRVYRGSSFVHTFGTTDPDNISIGSYTWYNFGTGGDFSTSSDGSVTLQSGDRIVITWDRQHSGNHSDYLNVEYKNADVYDGANTCDTVYQSSWSDNTSRDVTFKLTEAKKCPNDASSTSELVGMTNLPTNTIFEQTDDTPSYWWKQSDNTWKLDGGSEINVPMTASSWTFQGNQGSAHTHSIDNGVKWVSEYANNKLGAGVAVGTIGATLGSKWVARYNWTGTGSYTEGGNGYVIIGLSDDGTYGSSDTTNTQGGDSAQVQWHIGNNSGDRHYRVRGWNGGSNTDGSTTGGNTVSWVAETQYFELSYDGTTLKHQRYTDSTYSTAHSVVTPTKDISGITGLTHIIFGSNDTGHSHGGFTLTLNEFKIQKGFSEWQ